MTAVPEAEFPAARSTSRIVPAVPGRRRGTHSPAIGSAGIGLQRTPSPGWVLSTRGAPPHARIIRGHRRETERVSLFSEFPFPIFTRPTWMEVETGPEHTGRAPRGSRSSELPRLRSWGLGSDDQGEEDRSGFPRVSPSFFLMGTVKTRAHKMPRNKSLKASRTQIRPDTVFVCSSESPGGRFYIVFSGSRRETVYD